ncbi:divergent protein kinase domain 2A-like [Diadema antillarum]|uniref:divergent protein kinase domain 2A-like n=1 Tax=Diadema antillarum TaxID=105358 RepID=UPI003A88C864
MGPRLRKRILIFSGSLLFTIFSFQLTGFNALRGDEESHKFTNNALPSTKNHFRTFVPISKKDANGGKSLQAGRHSKGGIRIDSKDTRRTLQDVRTADDIKGHPRLQEAELAATGEAAMKNATVSMTTRLQFEQLFPSLLEEGKCPLCYGTGNCDQIYTGNISFHIGKVNLSEPHVITGDWGGRRIVAKRLVRRETFQRLESIVCQEIHSDPRRPCEVNIAATNSWMSKSSALDRVQQLQRDVYKESILSLSATTCASPDFFELMKHLYGVTRRKSGLESMEMAFLATTLAVDPEPALLKFFRTVPSLQPYFPEYLGECGRVILTETSGSPLAAYLPASWKDRVGVAIKVLQMVEDFYSSSDKWLIFLWDFQYENFAVTPQGKLRVVNLGSIVVVDKELVSTTPDTQPHLHNRTDVCNEDCLNSFAKKLQTDPAATCSEVPLHVEFMYMMACHSLLSDLFTTKYESFFRPANTPKQQHIGGLLHDAPYDVDGKLSELLYECVYESQPGSRMQSVRILKRLLHILQRGFTYQSNTARDGEKSL